MIKKYFHPPVPKEQLWALIGWAEIGLKHPRVVEHFTPDFLALAGNNLFWANFIGFVLVGKYGEPEQAIMQYTMAHQSLSCLLGIDCKALQGFLPWISRVQEEGCENTVSLIEMIRNGIDYVPPLVMPWKNTGAQIQ